MGEVVSDWRTRYDLWGAHVTLRNVDRNFRGIGICLIGNFENTPVPEIQYQSLVQLTKSLMAEYHIPVSNVTGHGLVEGEHTKCPGQHFPLDRFIKDLM